MKSLLIIMTFMAVALAAYCPDDLLTKNCSTQLAAANAAVAANKTYAVRDSEVAENYESSLEKCVADYGENVTDITTNVTVTIDTCASQQCQFAVVYFVESQEYRDLYDCLYYSCGCGHLFEFAGACEQEMEFQKCQNQYDDFLLVNHYNNTAAMADYAKQDEQVTKDALWQCALDNRKNFTYGGNTITLDTCETKDCEYNILSPIQSQTFKDYFQCMYSVCACGTLPSGNGSITYTMSFGLLLAFEAWLIK